MATAAACRTFNVLVSERRRVVAALLVTGTTVSVLVLIGAVMLAVGYQIFMGWVDEGGEGATAQSGQTEATAWASNGGG